MDSPHGDHAPARPATSAAAIRAAVSTGGPRSGRPRAPTPPASARDLGLVEHHAEHLPSAVAVPRQRAVAVDAARVVGAAVDELAHVALAAAVPGAVDLRREPELAAGCRAHLGARRPGQRPAAG